MIVYSFLPSFSTARSGVSSIISTLSLILSLGAAPALMAQEEPAPIAESETPAAAAAPAEAAPATDPATPEAAPTEAASTIPVQDTAPPPAEAAAPIPEGSTKLDTIEVTGSRIRRTDYETAQPVVVVTREDIERTGLTNIGDILQRIPAAGSALNRAFNNGGAGTTEVDLRNLGSNRVLVLVNGHRWVNGTSFANTSAVDLNTIPVSIIERIEVLKDGASAIYGSDAITGVVNIITRKDFSGAELGAQFQSFEDGKGMVQAHHLSFGNIAGKSSIFMNLNFVKQNELFAGDREISAVPKFGTKMSRGSIHLPRGVVIFIPNGDNLAALGPELCPDIVAASTVEGETGVIIPPLAGVALCQMTLLDGQRITQTDTAATARSKYQPFPLGGDELKYNYAPINYLLTPFEQNSLFVQINQGFTDSLNFSTQILYNNSRTERQIAETPVLYGDLTFPPFNQTYIDATNIYNPFNQDIGRHAGQGSPGDPGLGVGTGLVTHRFNEFGPRILTRDVRTIFVKPQFDGSFDALSRLFSYDAGYSYGESAFSGTDTGNINMERLKLGLGPSVNCPDLVNNPDCVPVDFFGGEGSVTKEQRDYLFYTGAQSAKQKITDTYANLSTEFSGLSGLLPYNLFSAPIGVALGAEYRTEEFSEQPDALVEQGISSTNGRKRTEGGYNVREAYFELAIPILSDVFLVDELDLSLAGRYTEYNTFDPKNTGKIGLRWKPIEDLLVRGTYSQAFRAPAVTDLFLGATDSFPALADPCVGPRTAGTAVDDNCTAEGVPDSTQQFSSQILTRFEGNKKLQPETANTFTTGLVYSPGFLPDFNVYVDYFDIDLVDFINFLDPQFILDSCYQRASGSPRPETCDFVTRNGDGSISYISAKSFNFAELRTKGVDFAFDYMLPIADWIPAMRELGSWKFVYDSQYLTTYDQFTPNSDGSSTKESFEGQTVGNTVLPRYKANTTLEWALNNWKASWSMRYIHSTTESCDDGISPALQTYGVCSDPDPAFLTALTDGVDDSRNDLKAIIYHNVQAQYVMPVWNTELTFGVNNLLDQDPPLSMSAFANSFPATLYEAPASRQPYLRLKINF